MKDVRLHILLFRKFRGQLKTHQGSFALTELMFRNKVRDQ